MREREVLPALLRCGLGVLTRLDQTWCTSRIGHVEVLCAPNGTSLAMRRDGPVAVLTRQRAPCRGPGDGHPRRGWSREAGGTAPDSDLRGARRSAGVLARETPRTRHRGLPRPTQRPPRLSRNPPAARQYAGRAWTPRRCSRPAGVPPRRRFAGAQGSVYAESGAASARDFIHRSRPRRTRGRLILELQRRLRHGETSTVRCTSCVRRFGTARPTNQWFREATCPRERTFGGSVGTSGFAPITAVEFGVLAGFQYSSRIVNTQTVTLTGPGDAPDPSGACD